MAATKGKLIVLSAPSGAGKTTIVSCLLVRNKKLVRSISYTTRKPRKGEIDGRDYHFISESDFSEKRKKGFFLESAVVFGASYGTSKVFVKEQVSKGVSLILAIDVQGMKQIKRNLSAAVPCVTVFVMPPSLDELETRLAKRQTENEEKMKERLSLAEKEMAEQNCYDHVVVNHRVDDAVKEIEEMIQ